jgi:hypothetical protein
MSMDESSNGLQPVPAEAEVIPLPLAKSYEEFTVLSSTKQVPMFFLCFWSSRQKRNKCYAQVASGGVVKVIEQGNSD